MRDSFYGSKCHKITDNLSEGEMSHPENVPDDDMIEDLTMQFEKTNSDDSTNPAKIVSAPQITPTPLSQPNKSKSFNSRQISSSDTVNSKPKFIKPA